MRLVTEREHRIETARLLLEAGAFEAPPDADRETLAAHVEWCERWRDWLRELDGVEA